MKDEKGLEKVVVADVNMPLLSMTRFMVKWAIASIPAIIILTIMYFVMTAILVGLAGV